MKNKVKFGLSQAYYAVKNIAVDGTISYGTPVKIPGSVNLNLDQVGDVTKFYADNIVYYKSTKNNGYEGNFEVADIPKSFKTDILGYIEDSNGALVENANAVTKEFALLYEVEGDKVPRRAVFYNCTVTRPSTSAKTEEENSSPQTDTLNITATAREDNKNVKAVLELSDSNKTVFNTFYETVYEPTAV